LGFSLQSELIEVPTKLFIEEWDEFEMLGCNGMCGISIPNHYIFEFINDLGWVLYSNFQIDTLEEE
jgi:hypothetical protein